MFWIVLILQGVFWGSLAALAHTYAVYPLLLRLLVRYLPARFLRHPKLLSPSQASTSAGPFPHVVAFMAVYNEEAVLERTLQSLLAVDYPADRFHIVLGSDHSTDGSHDIIRRCQELPGGPGLELQIFPGRCGKICIINQLVEERTDWIASLGDDVVFILCDANVRWTRGLVKRMVRDFSDPRVGLVAPRVVDESFAGRGGISQQENAYIDRENGVKLAESVLWGCMMGAFGACYALRGKLFRPMPTHCLIMDDFYQTMSCLEQGGDAVKDPAAVCYEAVSESIHEEFRRKRRISTGNFQNLAFFFRLFLPWRNPAVSFAFWSHKGLRWFGPLFLLAVFVSAAILSWWHWFYLFAFLSQLAVMAAAWLEEYLPRPVRLLRYARYFYVMNWALLMGGLVWLRGTRNSVWEPTRRVVSAAG